MRASFSACAAAASHQRFDTLDNGSAKDQTCTGQLDIDSPVWRGVTYLAAGAAGDVQYRPVPLALG